MTQPTLQPLTRRLSTTTETLTKLFLAFSASCYATGVFVTNIFAAKYGFYSLSLFRLNYVIAGFWALLVLAIFYFLSVMFVDVIRRNFDRKLPWHIRFMRILFTIATPFIFAPLLKQTAETLGISLSNSWIWIPLTGALGIWCLVFSIAELSQRLKLGQIIASRTLFLLIAIYAILTYVVGFSNELYQSIPSHLGGGQPQSVQLVLKNSLARQLQPVTSTNPCPGNHAIDSLGDHLVTTDTMRLILSTDAELILGSTQFAGSLSIKRNEVALIRFVHAQSSK